VSEVFGFDDWTRLLGFDMRERQPTERRCQVWWSGRTYGRHVARVAREGAAVAIPANVCGRVFMSKFDATVCDACAAGMARVDREKEDDLRQKGEQAAKAAAEREFKTGKRGSW
jgi:hypothetical protein